MATDALPVAVSWLPQNRKTITQHNKAPTKTSFMLGLACGGRNDRHSGSAVESHRAVFHSKIQFQRTVSNRS